MAFTIPNLADAAFAWQARPCQTDIDIIIAAQFNTGVKNGCAVTAQGSPNNTVAVAAGAVYWQGAEAAVTGGNVTMTAAHATLNRYDLIVASSAGAKSYVAGTAATNPVLPAIPATSIVLAAIAVPANDNVINANQIIDKGVLIAIPNTASLLTARTTGDDTNSSSQTPLDDDELIVAIEASALLAFDMWVQFTEASNANVSIDIGVPASATYSFSYQDYTASTAALAAGGMGLTSAQSNVSVDAGAGGSFFHIFGVVTNSTNAGSVKLKWARGSAAGSVTRKAGGYMTAVDIT